MAGGGAGVMGGGYNQPTGNPFGGYSGNGSRSSFGRFGQQAQNPYINSMPGPSSASGYMGQQMAMSGSPPYGMYQSRQQPPEPNQVAQPMPQQPQQPAYQNNPDYQAYQTQMNDLSRQMDEYVKKAPIYQQIQDLQNKMRGFQQPQQGQMGDTGFNRPMPAAMPQQPDSSMMGEMGLFTPETYGNRSGGGYGQQSMGIQGLYSMLQGRQQPQPTPPGMEMRRGMGGSYYVPAGTSYNPAMD